MKIGDPLKEWYVVPIEMPEPLREEPTIQPQEEPEEVPDKVGE